MGAAETKCCCQSNDANTYVFDVVNPQGTCQEVINEIQLPIAIDAALGTSESPETEHEEATDRWVLAKKDGLLTPQLLSAVRKDDGPAVLQYVADGTDFEEMGEALRLAAHRGSVSVVRELVAVGLSVNQACPQTGLTPLQLAASNGHLLVTELLLDALADVHMRIGSEHGPTALSLARKMGNPEVEEAIEQHIARQLVQEQGGANELSESPNQTRLHVLPRVSQGLSEVMLKNICPPKSPGATRALTNGAAASTGTAPRAAAERQGRTASRTLPTRPESHTTQPQVQGGGASSSSSRPGGGFVEAGTLSSGDGEPDGSSSGLPQGGEQPPVQPPTLAGTGLGGSSSSGGETTGISLGVGGKMELPRGRGPGEAGSLFSGFTGLGGGGLSGSAAGDRPELPCALAQPGASGDADSAIYALGIGLGVPPGRRAAAEQLQVQL